MDVRQRKWCQSLFGVRNPSTFGVKTTEVMSTFSVKQLLDLDAELGGDGRAAEQILPGFLWWYKLFTSIEKPICLAVQIGQLLGVKMTWV